MNVFLLFERFYIEFDDFIDSHSINFDKFD